MENQPNSTGQETVFISRGEDESFPQTTTINNQENSSNQEHPEEEIVTVKVCAQFEQPLFFRLKRTAPMKKLFDAFAKRVGLATATLTFRRDGDRISEADTPASLQLSDDEQIDVFQITIGGENGGDEQEQVENNTTDLLTIHITEPGGGGIGFRVKKTTQLQKTFEAFAERKGYDLKYIRFHYNGRRLTGTSTPKLQEMVDIDEIQALVEQHGGKE
jgi:small ubiquitin-related modifier